MDNPMLWVCSFFGTLGLTAMGLHKFNLIPRLRVVTGKASTGSGQLVKRSR